MEDVEDVLGKIKKKKKQTKKETKKQKNKRTKEQKTKYKVCIQKQKTNKKKIII